MRNDPTEGAVAPADHRESRPGAAETREPRTVPLNERLTWRMDDIAEVLGISRRALERERSAGRFPRPDLTIGRMPLWRVETIRAYVSGGRRP